MKFIKRGGRRAIQTPGRTVQDYHWFRQASLIAFRVHACIHAVSLPWRCERAGSLSNSTYAMDLPPLSTMTSWTRKATLQDCPVYLQGVFREKLSKEKLSGTAML